jgi:hypothetical protein
VVSLAVVFQQFPTEVEYKRILSSLGSRQCDQGSNKIPYTNSIAVKPVKFVLFFSLCDFWECCE